MKGRKPTPSALKLLTGNPGRRPLPANEPRPRRLIPSPPAHLSERAAVAWGSLSVRLDRLGLLTELDAEALEQLCENYAEILALRADIAENGRTTAVVTTTGDKREAARPVVAMLSDAEKRFRAMMCEFGLTPSARTRVAGAGDDSGKADPAEAYFG